MAYHKTDRVLAKSLETRERILRAVLQLIAEGGWRAVQIAAVADIAGVATGSVYRYFPDKGDLLAQAYGYHTGHETAVVAAIAQSEGHALERLEAAIRTFAQRAMRGHKLAHAMLAEPSDTQVEAARLDYHARFIAQFKQILDSGVAAGELQCSHTALTATCIVGALREALSGPLVPAAPERKPLRAKGRGAAALKLVNQASAASDAGASLQANALDTLDALCHFCLGALRPVVPPAARTAPIRKEP